MCINIYKLTADIINQRTKEQLKDKVVDFHLHFMKWIEVGDLIFFLSSGYVIIILIYCRVSDLFF